MTNMHKDPKTLAIIFVTTVAISVIFNLVNLAYIANAGYQAVVFFSIVLPFCFLPNILANRPLGLSRQESMHILTDKVCGPRIGFIASLLRWIKGIFHFTIVLYFMTVLCNRTYGHIFQTEPNKFNQLLLMLSFFGGITIFNLLKHINLFSTIGLRTVIPVMMLISCGIYILYHLKYLLYSYAILPHLNVKNLGKLPLAIATFTGIEASFYYIFPIKSIQKTYLKALGFIILAICIPYIIATASLVSTDYLDIAKGKMQFIKFLTNKSQLYTITIMLLIGMASHVNIWVISPLTALIISDKKLFKNNKNGSLRQLLTIQAILVGTMAIIFMRTNSSQTVFWFINITSTQLLVILYLLVFAAQLYFIQTGSEKNGYGIPDKKSVMLTIIVLGIVSWISAILLIAIKSDGITSINCSSQAYTYAIMWAPLLMILPELLVLTGSNPKKIRQTRSWKSNLAIFITKLIGWKINNITHPTALKKAVVILSPHTSNWDFFYGMLFTFSHPHLAIKFAIKKEVMIFPLSCLMNGLGAIPIDRNKKKTGGSNMVSVMADMLNKADALFLAVAPEGTRSYVKRWKTGFYRLSEATNTPIILGYINYAKKEMGLGPIFYPTGDMEKDITDIQDFYKTIPGKHPNQGVI